MLDELRTARQRTVGTKQTLKAVQDGTAHRVYVADDADPHVVNPLIALCRDNGVECEHVETMKALGRACGIQVGAAAASIVK